MAGTDGEILASIYLTIGVLGLTGNALVLTVLVYHYPMRKRLSNAYIGSQSTLDLLASLFLILTTLFEEQDGSKLSGVSGEIYCRVWVPKLPLWGFLVSSSFNLVALTIERYLAVVHAIWHKVHFNRTKVWISIATAVVAGHGYNIAYTVSTSGLQEGGNCTVFSIYPNPAVRRFNGVLIFILQLVVPLAVFIYCYTKMALVLRMRVHSTPAIRNTLTTNRSRTHRNIIKTMAMVSVCFVLCWVWNQVYFLMNSVGYEMDFNGTFYHFTVVAVFCNCCVNPFIYMAKYEQFQNGFRKLFGRKAKGVGAQNVAHTHITVQHAQD